MNNHSRLYHGLLNDFAGTARQLMQAQATFAPKMPAIDTVPPEFRAQHAEIMDCELRGQHTLAAALRNILNRQIEERGLKKPQIP